MDNAEPPTILGIEVHVARAVSYRRTNILQNLMPHFLASLEESPRQGIWVRHWFDMYGTVCAAIAVQAFPRTSLDALESRLETRIVPPSTARISPLIEVGCSPPHPYHRVNAAGPPDDLSPGPVDDTPRSSYLRCRAIRPINVCSKIGWPKHRAFGCSAWGGSCFQRE